MRSSTRLSIIRLLNTPWGWKIGPSPFLLHKSSGKQNSFDATFFILGLTSGTTRRYQFSPCVLQRISRALTFGKGNVLPGLSNSMPTPNTADHRLFYRRPQCCCLFWDGLDEHKSSSSLTSVAIALLPRSVDNPQLRAQMTSEIFHFWRRRTSYSLWAERGSHRRRRATGRRTTSDHSLAW